MAEVVKRQDRVCTIFGGANGSGKSSIFEFLKPSGAFINADQVARRINPSAPETASLAAGREVLTLLADLVNSGKSFVYETTLSSSQSLKLIGMCRRAGYRVDLIFVLLKRPELNIARVAERVERGGHDIPVDVILRRYEHAFERLPHAMELADTCLVFDNSSLTPKLVLSMESGTVTQIELDLSLDSHRRIGAIVERSRRRSNEIEVDPRPLLS